MTDGWLCWNAAGRPADGAEVRGAIRAEGVRRQAERAAALESDIEALGADQALYRAVMRALGYSANTRQFEAVAEAAPIELLGALAGPSLGERRVRVEAELLGAAGLLPSQRGQPAEHPHVRALEEAWAYTAPRAGPAVQDWTLAAVRPHNRPARRLAAAARLLSTAPLARRSLSERVAGQVLAANDGGRGRDLVGWFEVRVGPEDFWARHLDVGRRAARPLPALIGRGRSQELLVNAVLPFTAALGRLVEAAGTGCGGRVGAGRPGVGGLEPAHALHGGHAAAGAAGAGIGPGAAGAAADLPPLVPGEAVRRMPGGERGRGYASGCGRRRIARRRGRR